MNRLQHIPCIPPALLAFPLALALAGCTVSFGSSWAEDSDALVDGDGAVGDGAFVGSGDAVVNPDAVIDSDGCVPPSDQVLCVLQQQQCDPLVTLDHCGNIRDVAECGPCPAEHYCQSGACIAYLYGWVTGGWSACSVSCGGGSQTRSVVCQRDDGQVVADSYCSGTKPATSQSCNTQACCTPFCVSHDACGDDGCGGNCGSCSGEEFCWSGYCVRQLGNNGESVSCHELCSWDARVCVGTNSSTNNCSSTNSGEHYGCYCW